MNQFGMNQETKFIYLTGPDGCGKTTYLKLLEELLIDKGYRVGHLWIRSPKILSKPLMAYCRFVKLTQYFTINNIKYGKHDFYKSKFVSFIFPYLQYFDFKIKFALERKKISDIDYIILDRFSIDTLADLMADTHRFDLHRKKIGIAFTKLLPPNCITICLKVDEKKIRERKLDTKYDPQLSTKVQVYKILIKDLQLPIVDNNREINIVQKDILKELKFYERV